MNRRSFAAFLLLATAALTACGGSPKPLGLENHTSLSDAHLLEIWAKAQENIATKATPINPWQHRLHPEIPLRYHAPDPKALKVAAHVSVWTHPDVLAEEINAELHLGIGDPSGYIECDICDHGGWRYFTGWSRCESYETHYAASWDKQTDDWQEFVIGWEFESQILYVLGESTDWR